MNDVPLSVLFSILALLIVFSGFFSSSETGMMSLNRYRLRHLVKNKHKGAQRAAKLLEKPDRLIGTILTGNNLVNFAAAALATIISQRLWPDNPDLAVFVNTILFTLVVLIFAELTPKTLAAIAPEKIAFPASRVLAGLQWLLYPFVWLVNTIANGLLKLIRVDVNNPTPDNLSTEELRTVVREAGSMIPQRHQHMLISILDLEKMTVNDIMVPRTEVFGIDLDDDLSTIQQQLRTTQHTRMPVYRGEINEVVGILHTRNISRFLASGEYLKEELEKVIREPYFIPESTPLHTQLFNFQKNQRRMALVVNEYGDVQGICTLEDILEEIVGEFTTDVATTSSPDVHPQEDGSFIIDGTAFVRDVNKALQWALPTDGPKTISGLIVEALEHIPDTQVCLVIDHYRIEILQIKDNTIRTARVTVVPGSEPVVAE
ncbi:HlyC/CorC family transporter [Bacterioplanoides sp. SCSIO 12839]|uniref:HlyC/CorC family transporter n=1 Tax=Bacterioplanoides sp. SCSIO 12839 TaxID=2829569 RepID=UPI0021045D77|nr:HlyC/CorC family transporter [Bacterioplanoides sp. SCSIO 12839]UTW47548.1 HlyC/CorC family transporter [Bacterioplanoides sp. SCSIO 12839]